MNLVVRVVVFVLLMSVVSLADDRPFGNNVTLRGDLTNSYQVFGEQKKGHVAFLGGSITEMEGYRPMVIDVLKRRFPATEFTFTNAGIASTCSTTGAFRLESDVLAKGNVDLLFVEFAVNDDQDATHSRVECIRGMEGIIRHLRSSNPRTDIVMTFFVNEGMLATFAKGGTPLTVEAHNAVAEHYMVSTINLAKEVSDEISGGKLTWTEFGGVHPAPKGNGICARMIDELMARAWTDVNRKLPATEHVLPERMDSFSYSNGHYIGLERARIVKGWAVGVPDWNIIPGPKRSRFTSIPILSATDPGARFEISFEGTVLSAFVLAGPDAGILQVSVDGAPDQQIDLYHAYSKGLHYPRTVLLASQLKPGEHRAIVTVSDDSRSAGHAARIAQFGAN